MELGGPSAHPAQLHAVGQHDEGVALLLPHQAPEVAHRLGQGALGRNELPGAPETLRGEGGTRAVVTPGALSFSGPLPPFLLPGGPTGMKLALM